MAANCTEYSRKPLSPIQIVPFTLAATSESPQILRAFAGIITGILLQAKDDMIGEGFAAEEDYNQGMSEREFLLSHRESFGMGSTLLAVGRIPGQPPTHQGYGRECGDNPIHFATRFCE